ncbi:sorbosone dehydrogenase [Roseivirga seohaensis subsp. aquiponti]|uniref:Sorbosone dehydrogenase n=1 Tax=Roseivirga seohaensis subsp. aquiponti TaxID=1566026 RepID=A0A0L8ALJ4_9BACT|nr:sorbosone dehydrogenase family protein [Roseivirga seohaensis]KOF03363.1 sorbosone dehydrogenase [Roseivirga seohaensis subsp. aquiponti]
MIKGISRIFSIGLLTLMGANVNVWAQSEIDLSKIKLPEGFKISIYAEGITDARSLSSTPDGKTVFVGNRRRKNVYALTDTDGDMVADKTYKWASKTGKDWNMPNGVAYHNGDLYVAEVNRILRFPDIMNNLDDPKQEVIFEDYPTDAHHGWKFVAFGPDGKLYVPVGAPCNVCESEKEVYASITRMNPDGSNMEIYATGVRNSVGFAWDPKTQKMWFTDNGRDMMGDDIPACELNFAPEKGMNFGFPYWHQGDIPDPDFGDKFPRTNFTEPKYKFEPHSAPLGLRFYQGDMFPAKYKNNIIVAQHGSWNRSLDAGHIGYQLRFVQVEGDKVISSEIFASGWLDQKTNKGWGKPVDILEMPDGSILVSDDVAGVIYRISYEK